MNYWLPSDDSELGGQLKEMTEKRDKFIQEWRNHDKTFDDWYFCEHGQFWTEHCWPEML